jgi:hypothetical protein
MNVCFVTLSLGENYTRDYTVRLINDVLNRTQHSIYITTDCKSTITDVYGENERIHIKEITRDNLTIRLNTDWGRGYATDFNFNMRYMCLEPVKDLPDTAVIFTDCDNSLDWWDEEIVQEEIRRMGVHGFDFLAPRNSLTLRQFLKNYNQVKDTNPQDGIFWHKLFNFDLIDNPKPEWDEAPLPAEYLLIFINDGVKLNKFYNQWKEMHDYLVERNKTYGTWAEGFEIGVSSLVAGFVPYDINWHHYVWGKAITANGYKVGHKTES